MKLHAKVRTAFTLIELLVVITLMLVLSGLALLLSPRIADDQRVARGADQVSGWLLIGKQRTFRDQVPRGVRLVRDSTNPNWVKELVYIERPEDLRGSFLVVPGIPQMVQPNRYDTVWIPPTTTDPTQWFNSDIVLPGDFLQMNANESTPYNVHRINQVIQDPLNRGGTLLILAAADGTPSPINIATNRGRINVSPNLTPNGSPGIFQIVRSPRPMAGEASLPLPRDVIIDFDPSTDGTSQLAADTNTGNLDIVFNERGQVIGDAGRAGKIVLRLRGDRPFNPNMSVTSSNPQDLVYDSGEQLLITVYTRTGLIATHPVNPALNPNPNGTTVRALSDPFLFTRDGLTSGM